jgi:hypothetical protein
MSISASAQLSTSLTGTVSITASELPTLSQSLTIPTAPSPSLQAPSSTTLSTHIITAERSQVGLTRTPSSVSMTSSIALGSDIFNDRSLFDEPILEDIPMEPSLLSTHRTTAMRSVGSHQAVLSSFSLLLHRSHQRAFLFPGHLRHFQCDLLLLVSV